MTTYLIDNNYVIYGLISCGVCLISGFFIKSYFYSTLIETPNSPQTFNFSPEQMREIKEFMEEGGVLNEETNEKLDQDLQTIMGEDLYNNFQADLQSLDNEFSQALAEIFNNF